MADKFIGDEFKEIIREFNKSMDLYHKEIYENLSQSMNSISEALKPVSELGEFIAESLKPITLIKFPKIEFSRELKDVMEKFAVSLKDSIESIEDYKKFCLLIGYPPQDNMAISEIRGIASIYKELNGDIDKIKPIIDGFYIEKFNAQHIKDEFFARWSTSEWLGKRIGIIEESINCFEQELYFSAIPLIFSQLEGLVADKKGHIGQMNGLEFKNYMYEIFNDEGRYSFDDELLKFYISTLYVGFGHGEELKSFLSRHAIMHGGDVEYGTRINYIKLILFFDSVYNKLVRIRPN